MKTIDKNKIKEAANNYVVYNFLEECTMKQYIIDSFETGFELCEQVFKEKLRWIPVEESMPIEREIVIIKVNRRLTEKVTSTHIAIGECLINSFTGNLWIFDKSYSAGYVTHWRHIL